MDIGDILIELEAENVQQIDENEWRFEFNGLTFNSTYTYSGYQISVRLTNSNHEYRELGHSKNYQIFNCFETLRELSKTPDIMFAIVQIKRIFPEWSYVINEIANGFQLSKTCVKAIKNIYIYQTFEYKIRIQPDEIVEEIIITGQLDHAHQILGLIEFTTNLIPTIETITTTSTSGYGDKITYKEVCWCSDRTITENIDIYLEHFDISSEVPISHIPCSNCRHFSVAFVEPTT